ncbi:MAG TPA: mannose-6-phosphate isomerase, partial [Bacteroidales bacterium]|nr:mannose-6-phosphate isomerase [Bacteroidales bacterium]
MRDITNRNTVTEPNFNQHPAVPVREYNDGYSGGWNEISGTLSEQLEENNSGRKVIVVDCYQGVLFEELLSLFSDMMKPVLTITSRDYFLPPEEISRITWPDVTDDRVFGYVTRLTIKDFISPGKLDECRSRIDSVTGGTVLVFGYGAALAFSSPDLLIYADMPRREIVMRMRSGRVNNLGISNKDELFEQQYKRGFFVDWRVCDRHKKKLKDKWSFVLDSADMSNPAMIRADCYDGALTKAVSVPFSVVPTFDPGLWGGQWMKEKLGLDPSSPNYAWCFNCIVEENSLLFDFGRGLFETPASNLVYFRPVELLGEAVYGRFGDEFPIRFDYLDTIEGGNLSLQVHPVTEYIQEKFGMHYTQDESYYIVDTGEDASVYLGLREGISPAEMIEDLLDAQNGNQPFDDTRYVNRWPAEKHDHFLIPGGT